MMIAGVDKKLSFWVKILFEFWSKTHFVPTESDLDYKRRLEKTVGLWYSKKNENCGPK